MDGFGELLGGFGELIGDFFAEEAADSAQSRLAEMFGFAPRGRDGENVPIVYERYLCGGPRKLNVNDR